MMQIGLGAANAIGSFIGGQSEADAQNAAAREQYKQQLKIREAKYLSDLGAYNLRKAQYRDQMSENFASANRAYASEQNRLNEIYKQAAFASQGANIKAIQGAGRAAASGRMGANAARMRGDVMAEFGRGQAMQAESLMSAQNALTTANKRTRQKLAAANRRAFYNVGAMPSTPVMPIKPTAVQGPSPLSLLGGLGEVAISGMTMENDIRKARGQKPLFS